MSADDRTGEGPVSHIAFDRASVRRLNWFGLKPVVARLLAAPVVNPAVRMAASIVMPAHFAQRLPLNKPQVTYWLDDGNSIILLDALRDTVAKDIWHGKGKPTQAAEQHKLQLFEQLAKSAGTCLDIGAYAGLFALIAARSNPALRAIAFEIVPENYLLLVRNIIANDLVERVDARLLGLAASKGSMTIPSGFGAASLMSSISLGADFADGVSIPIDRLDDQARDVKGPVLMKIDVEGFEAEVFEGGMHFISAHRPDIICEILPGANQSCEMITRMLKPLGYAFFCIEEQGPARSDAVETRPAMRDWLFKAESRTGAPTSKSPRGQATQN